MKIIDIQIKKDSIVHNKNAGSRYSTIPTSKTIEFKCTGENPSFVDGKNCIIIERSYDSVRGYSFSGIITDETMLHNIEDTSNIEVCVSYNSENVDHLPEPKFFFEYESVKIECPHCNSDIYTDDLEYEGDFILCPICGNDVSSEYDFIYESLNENEYE